MQNPLSLEEYAIHPPLTVAPRLFGPPRNQTMRTEGYIGSLANLRHHLPPRRLRAHNCSLHGATWKPANGSPPRQQGSATPDLTSTPPLPRRRVGLPNHPFT